MKAAAYKNMQENHIKQRQITSSEPEHLANEIQ
jgi:hypothetical protein